MAITASDRELLELAASSRTEGREMSDRFDGGISTLQKENASLRARETGLVQHVELLQQKVSELKERKFVRFNGEECWLYDSTESDEQFKGLVCPVVISAADLKDREAKLLEEVKAICSELYGTPLAGFESQPVRAFMARLTARLDRLAAERRGACKL